MTPTPREKYLQRTAQAYAHLLIATGQPIPELVLNARQDAYCCVDFTEQLHTALIALRDKSQRAFDTMIKANANRDLRDWYEADRNKHIALRKQSSNRHNAGKRMGIVSK